jgi:hypothetical protein
MLYFVPVSDPFISSLMQEDAKTRFSAAHAGETHVVRGQAHKPTISPWSWNDDKSRPRLPADDDEESDGAQVDEEPRRIEGPHGPGERRHWCAPAECGREHLKAIFDRG